MPQRFAMPALWRARAGVFGAGLLAMFSGAAAQEVQPVSMEPASGIKIEVTNPYGFVPQRGYVPLRVSIANGSNDDGSWRFKASADASFYARGMYRMEHYATEQEFAVPAHTTREFEVLAPRAETPDYRYRQLQMNISGTGVQGPYLYMSGRIEDKGPAATKTKRGLDVKEVYQVNGREGPLSDSPVYLGLSPALFQSQGDDIKDYLLNICRRPLGLARLDPDRLSADWRAYTGLTLMIYTAADWTSAPAAARAAILQWVATGGALRLVADQEGGLALPARAGERYGAGFLALFTTGELDDYDYATARYIEDERFLFNMEYHSPMTPLPKAPPPADAFDAKRPSLENHFFLVACLILIFGLLVGPVNLFWFCRGARRARLLWVTPLLSLGTAVVLMGYIMISEGIGGEGIYYRVTLLEPQGKLAVVAEVMSSKTGVMLRRSFTLPEPSWVVELATDSGVAQNAHYYQAGRNYWGEWIKTRHEQSMLATAVMASRAAVRRAPGAPALTSEYNGLLESLFYLDAEGRPWKAARLGNGQTVRLEPATKEELADAWAGHLLRAPPELRGLLQRCEPRPGAFFALSTNDAVAFEPDLYGLQWTCYRHVVTGRVEP